VVSVEVPAPGGRLMIRTLVVENDAFVAEVHASYVERIPRFRGTGEHPAGSPTG
jgi:hypothetical protein